MRWQFLGLVLLGLIAAASAAVLVAAKNVVPAPATPVNQAPTPVKVVVAARALDRGIPVGKDDVAIKEVLPTQVPGGAFNDPVQIIGQVLVTPMVPEQAFTKNSFAADGPGVYLAGTLPEGHRAMSVSLSDYSGLDGLLYPGCAVDVLASLDLRNKTESEAGVVSVTLLQNVHVLAIEDRTAVSTEKAEEKTRTDGRRRRVTLMVTPKEAEELHLATEHGVISLAMRNPRDKQQEDETERLTRLAELGPAPRPAPAAEKPAVVETVVQRAPEPKPVAAAPKEEAKKPVPWTTVVIKGGQSSTRTFPIEEEAATPGSK